MTTPLIELIPAIDLMDGHCVRLQQGDAPPPNRLSRAAAGGGGGV